MSRFAIAAAQVASLRGDVARNVRTHAEAIEAAPRASVLVSPELSLVGYEPELAATLALDADDARLDPIAESARRHATHVFAGAPLIVEGRKPALGAIVFGPDGTRRTYAKMHLGGGERDHFEPGGSLLAVGSAGQTVGLCICADSSAPSHPRAYAAAGATVYAAGVFLNAEWYATDEPRLAAHASAYGMLVVMANHAASVGTFVSVGGSAVWGPDGTRLARAEGTQDALVVATLGPGGWRAEVRPLRSRRGSE